MDNLIKYGISILIIIIFYTSAIVVKKKIENKQILYIFLSSVSYYLIIFIGVIISLNIIGFDVNKLFVIFGTIGLALALGFKDVLSDSVSGLIIIIFDYFNNGDVVEIDNSKKTVKDFNLYNTIFSNTNKVMNTKITSTIYKNYNDKEEIYFNINIRISNNKNIDYDKLFDDIKNDIINNCEHISDKESISVNISDMSTSGTELIIAFLVKSKDNSKTI